MRKLNVLLLAGVAAALSAAPAIAQQSTGQLAQNETGKASGETTATVADDKKADAKAARMSTQPVPSIQYIRPADQRGINVFETSKEAGAPYAGFKLDWTAAFSQQFQGLEHSNAASPRMINDAAGKPFNANELGDIGWGFNLAAANLGINAQLAPGVRLALESYMSSRHHNEFWVKGGYVQVDESPIDLPVLHTLMQYLTIKAGMFELNYGDAHFRRTDNGNSFFNPFVENNILDAFNTEIGTEIYAQTGPFMAMVGITDGVNKGGVTNPDARGPAYLAKLAFDQQLTPLIRTRLSGSMYSVAKTPSNNLYFGDRSGSRYFNVLDNSTGSNHFNARINPGFSNEMRAIQINPFVKVAGLEFFGVLERAEGKHMAETERREWTQLAGEVVYRFLPGEQLYVAGRYNTASGHLRNIANELSVDRTGFAAGWFMTPSILLKAEYVNQKYNDFPVLDIRHGGKFNGFMVEGAIAF
jgi:hypothetical protein